MLIEKYGDTIDLALLPIESIRPFPSISNREAWEKVSSEIKDIIIEKAEQYKNVEFKSQKLSVLIEAQKSGDTSEFINNLILKTHALNTLALAECITNKGEYISDILDAIWSMCDESIWNNPLNSYMHREKINVVNDITDPILDLGSTRRAHLLTYVYYLLQDKLDSIDINIKKRIKSEVEKRVMIPFMEREDIWWMLNYRKINAKMDFLHPINNWTPYCVSKVLLPFLIFEEDYKIRHAAVKKTMTIMDKYIKNYPEDGCCDEGIGYWFMAPGALVDYLILLNLATGGVVDIFDDEKIKKMGEYVFNVYIGENRFVNFADATPTHNCVSALYLQYAEKTKNDTMMRFGYRMFDNNDFLESLKNNIVFDQALYIIFNNDLIKNKFYTDCSEKDYLIKEHYYNDVQVLVSREFDRSTEGLFLGAKAGNNNESHNHNDIGNFVVYKNCKPVLVDPGVEAYTSKTFSKERYNLWTMQSKYHNVPIINELQQKETHLYKATNVKYEKSKLSMNLKEAYEKNSGIVEYNREMELVRGENSRVIIKDNIELFETTNEIEFSFITPCEVKLCEDRVEFYKNDTYLAKMSFKVELYDFSIEKIIFADPILSEKWDDKLYRFSLKLNKSKKNINEIFIIE